MPRPTTSEAEFIELYRSVGQAEMARRLKLTETVIHQRRRRMEARLGHAIVGPTGAQREYVEHAPRITFDVFTGEVIVGSDAHIWPGDFSTGMRAFTKFVKDMQPAAVIMNGDVLDFPQISRHPPIGHQSLPNVQNEIEAAQEQLHRIELSVKRSTKLIWTLGNHDARFETRLATIAPEFARLHGHSLKNYFPAWSACWSAWINDSVVVKHRWKGGLHATHNNTVGAGKTMVTGHLHSAKVTPYTDYTGTRWGVDTGTLADPMAKQFLDYTEDNPKNWRQAFGVFTFHQGRLLPPELVEVWDRDTVTFRGQLIKV